MRHISPIGLIPNRAAAGCFTCTNQILLRRGYTPNPTLTAGLYNVQHLTSNTVDPVAKVVITTIQRLDSMLRGDSELDLALEESSQFGTDAYLVDEPVGVAYAPSMPVEFFDCIFVDECHRLLWA